MADYTPPTIATPPTTIGAWALNTVQQVDALDLLHGLPPGSVDAIIADPPYNMTRLAFEQPIDWSAFWLQARRVLKAEHSPTILFSQQPFTTDLIMSNRQGWRDEIVWEKTMPVGFLNAKHRPLECHELIEIFADREPEYSPQMETVHYSVADVKQSGKARHYGDYKRVGYSDNGTRYPRSVWTFAQRDTAFQNTVTLHPTQKPLPLMHRLINTYTRPGWLILDPFAGSGSTLVAAQILGRQFIGSDLNPEYVAIARRRLAEPYTPNFMPWLEQLDAVQEITA